MRNITFNRYYQTVSMVTQNNRESRCGRVSDLFSEHAVRNPGAVALVLDDEILTYGDLDERSNQLAQHLQTLGVGPEQLVAVYADRSFEMVIALLGILKAGGAYLPIDPIYPRDRVKYMLADSGASVLLTQSHLHDNVRESAATVFCLDTDWLAIQDCDSSPVDSAATADNLAYVIYTSGSTGAPKGVSVTHKSVVHLFHSTRSIFNFTPADTWTSSHSFAFDLSVWEIFGALTSGATLVLVPVIVAQSQQDFYEMLRRNAVTVLSLTPPALRQLCDARDDAADKGVALRLIVAGGDVFPSDLVRPLLDWNVDVWNFYGPTESTVWSTIKRVTVVDAEFNSALIGRPLPDLTAHVLDEELTTCAREVAGELHLGGSGLARGYFKRPELTAEKFIPDPFSHTPGARLYKTGDMARSLNDGNLEHLGRIDHQVKIRGFRIELGEIEALIKENRRVAQTVVTATGDFTGERRLVAYVVPAAESGNGSAPQQTQEWHTSDWNSIWDETYKAPAPSDPTFNITGWKDSYSGSDYSAEEMREWVAHTVDRILQLHPERVLEIGCGSGLLLYRIAPHCHRYVGTDASALAVNSIAEHLSSANLNLPQVQLLHRMGDDFSGFEPGSFDTVILNSVIQYFPSADYLEQVLRRAVKVVRAGGSIFVGDVRNLALQEPFFASIQLHNAPDNLSTDKLREQWRKQMLDDEQLAVAPEFFYRLKQLLPQITNIRFDLKRGHFENETIRYRYDVVLQISGAAPVEDKISTLDWKSDSLDLPSFKERLIKEDLAALRVRSIPNARIEKDMRVIELASQPNTAVNARELRQSIAALRSQAVNPEQVASIAQSLGYAIEMFWSTSDAGHFDALLYKEDAVHASRRVPQQHYRTEKPLNHYVNNPLSRFEKRELLTELRASMAMKLPDYMQPSAFVFLQALPLTRNGKIDRMALPAPDRQRPALAQTYVAPRNSAEQKLSAIWSGLLKLDRVGVFDNFFELGGHSLIATQVISRVRETFNVNLSLRTIFEGPTVAQLAEKLAGHESDDNVTIPQRPAGSRVPLSSPQERLWFLEQLVTGSSIFNLPTAVRIKTDLNVKALDQAINELVRRHESLRTKIAVVAGEPFQEILNELVIKVPLFDLSGLTIEEREAEEQRHINNNAETPFNVGRAPLMRASVLKRANREYVLLLCLHHIVTDHWGMVVFFQELSALYETFARNEDPGLPELPIQYGDYAVWQRVPAAAVQMAEHVSYWRTQLADAPPLLELPADYPRPPVITLRGARHSLKLPASLVHDVRRLSQQRHVTTFMTLLTVFNLLLSRYAGQEDVVIGSPIANRNQKETEGLVGLFLNNLVLRTRIDGDQHFFDLLNQVRNTVLEAHTHQDIPFETLVRELQPQRDLSRTPLFQVFFNMFDVSDNHISIAGQLAEIFSPMAVASQFDMTMYVGEARDTIELTLVYNSDIFAPERLAPMLPQFQYLLEQVVENPEQRVSDLSLVHPQSRELVPDPTIALDEPKLEPITETFLNVALERPTHPAIHQAGASWSYRELATRAIAIARFLIADGVSKGDIVAVTGTSTAELIACMLGVFQSGGVLLTLDQNLPLERQKLMLEESRAQRLLAAPGNDHEWITEIENLQVTDVASIDNVVNADALLPVIDPSDPAYLFFTSGTSGVPKGVLGCHRGLSHFLKWQREEFNVTPADRSAQLTGLSFDVVLRDIFLPLTSGASLHLPAAAIVQSPQHTLEWLDQECITIIHTVPSLAQAWLNARSGSVSLQTLRWTFFAGEPLTDALVKEWRTAFPHSGQLANFYGPTETTLAKCSYVVPANPPYGVQPVGEPLPNTQAMVLNKEQRCGVGEAGEIVIRTPFRTLGYINAQDEAATRFIQNPFRAASGDVLYRTGDRGRYRYDGLLEILGRLDYQVKIRGVRVESDEVNAVIARHASVAASIVVAIRDERNENALVAYIVPRQGSNLDLRQLKSHLEQQLPSAMVPALYVLLAQMPLTANGKVDRRALPQPDLTFAVPSEEFIAPRDETEALIVGVWEEVLGIDSISVRGNFFDLGGHSLRAMQVLSRINTLFGIELPLAALFTHATVESLARAVEHHLVAQLELMPDEQAHQLLS